LEVGLARRTGDPAVLARTWHAAREAILLQPIDLFVLLPLGEFVVAAAVVDESRLLDNQLSQAWSLLERLGNPEVWSIPLHWSALQAAAVSQSAAGVATALRSLDRDSPHGGYSPNGYSRALACAARSWSAVMSGVVDADDIQDAAAGLQRFGLSFEAAVLLSEAAGCTGDRRVTASLLHLARTVRGCPDAPNSILPAGPTASTTSAISAKQLVPASTSARASEAPPSSAVLSGRELQVARLLQRNQTYREIGERLFISPKTVEHHVARMKQRVGASRRSELFSHLRELTDSFDA
jgi:DNA-binding CsgD family transcriptional regulator